MTTYAYDPSGTSPANLIVNELRYIQPPAEITDASFFIPTAAPFFKEGFELWTGPNRTGTRLVEGEHFNFCFALVAVPLAIGKILYGGAYLLDASYTGNLYIRYQTIGGNNAVNSPAALETLYRKLHEIVYITWDMIDGVPATFVPAYHLHEESDDTMQQVIDGLSDVKDALVTYFNP